MALSRIGNSADLTNLFVRSSYAATSPRHGRQNVEQLHATVVRRYPEAPQLTLPSNVSEIFNTETARFAPERARDMAAPLFLYGAHHVGDCSSNSYGFGDSVKMRQLDSRIDSYDCFGSVSLNGSMQTNVPKPFCASGKSTYLNMPGGQWARDGKYLAEIMRKSHFSVLQMREMMRSGRLDGQLGAKSLEKSVVRSYSTDVKTANKMSEKKPEENKDGEGKQAVMATPIILSKRERLQIMIKDLGKTIIVFHVAISLVSLGCFYALVSSGIDITPVIQIFSGGTAEKSSEDELVKIIMSEGSTFLIAYGVHKLFAPIRLSLTLCFAPILVKYLRRKGILKLPKRLKTVDSTTNAGAPR